MKVFISYAREDADHADRLFRALSEIEELSPWLDRQQLMPGARWKDEILTALEESRFVALILSTRSVSKTGFVQKEFQTAIDRLSYHPPGSIFLIPVRVEPCTPKYRELSDLQFVDMFPDWEAGLARLRKAITSQIDEDLGTIFQRLRDCEHYYYPKEKEWIDSYSTKVLAYGAPSLIRAIDNANDRYSAELYCLKVMAEVAKKANSSLLLDLVIRMHDITKMCQFDHEMPSFYGTFLYGSSLLGNSARALLLRAAVSFWIEHTSGYNQGSWWSDLAFRDLLKHFIAAETSTYISGQTMSRVPHFSKVDVGRLVTTGCLPLISWDIARADFLTFWARRTGRFQLLTDVANHLLGSFGRQNFGSDSNSKWRPDVPAWVPSDQAVEPRDRLFEEIGGYGAEVKVANYREDRHRLGILLRIAEYLGYLKAPHELVEFAKRLSEACIEVLSSQNSKVGQLLADLPDRQRRRLFWLIERQASVELQEMLDGHAPEDCKYLLGCVPWSSQYYSKEANDHLAITLPRSALPLDPSEASDEGM